MVTLVSGGAVPVGSILPFGGDSASIPDGFLLCAGGFVNRNDFADLFAVIGTRFGTTSGTNFGIPDLRGNHIRGVAYGSGADPDRNTRSANQTGGQTGDQVGSIQGWGVQSHNHGATTRSYGGGNNVVPITDPDVGFRQGAFGRPKSNNFFHDNGMTITFVNSTGGNQTMGRNVYTNFIIKY